ncbi:MAG: hypothetical protein QM817_37155 [Archangium sp.]
MKRSWAVLALLTLSSTVAFAGTKFVGGGLLIGPTAPVLLPVANPSQKIHVSQILYTQVELGFAANTHIIDVAWRKEGLGPTTGAGGCAEQVWMKNVTRQMGPFTVGSSQTLVDALQNAQKVIDKPASMLPSTMGFVTLDVVENQFNFVYLGDALEVTVITDCRGAAVPAVDAPISWRYDEVPERVRVTSGDTTDAMVLVAEPALSSFRPHTRFRTLIDTPGIEIRIAQNLLPNGGTFAVAPKHFAAGLPANFAFEVWNPSTQPLIINSFTASGQNGTEMHTLVTPVTVAGGQSLATPLIFGPTLAGTLSRLTVTWNTSAGTQTNTFQGTPTAMPETQPSASFEKPDGTTQVLMMGTPLVSQRGTVPPGHVFESTAIGSNFGQGQVEAHAEVVSGDATVVTPSAMVGSQQDVRIITRCRAPMTRGPFVNEIRVVVGGLTFLVREMGTVAAPDLKISVGGVEIVRGTEERIARPSRDAFTRTYDVANVGSLPLLFEVRLYRERNDGALEYAAAAPFALLPGSSVPVPFEYPALDPTLEPFTFHTISNDPTDFIFSWTAATSLPGKKQLAVSIESTQEGSVPVTASGAMVTFMSSRTVVLRVANVGEEPVTLTSLGERCRGCRESERTTPPLPLTLQPGEVFERTVPFEVSGWRLEYAIESDAEGSPLSFVVEGSIAPCGGTAFPGPLLLGLLALWFTNRRARRN